MKLLRSKLVQASSLSFIIRIFSVGMAFVIRVLLARLLGESGLGIYQYSLSWINVLLVVSVFGLDRLLVREIAGARADNRPDLVHGLLRFGNIFSLITSTLTMIIVMLVVVNLDLGTTASNVTMTALLLSPLLLPLHTNIRIRQAAMQGFDKTVIGQVPEYIGKPLIFFAFLTGGRWLLTGNINPVTALIFHILSMLATVVLGFYVLIKYTPDEVKSAKPSYEIRTWFSGAIPLIVLAGVNIINNQLDILMLGSLDSFDAVGVYSTCVQIASLLSFVLVASNAVLAPTYSRLYRSGKMERLQYIVTNSIRITMVVYSVLAILLFLLGTQILSVFGPGFLVGRQALNIIILGHLVNVFLGPVGYLLTMTSHAWYPAIGTGIGAIVNIVLNLILIPRYGMDGAAVATLITYTVWNGLLAFFVWRKLNIIVSPIGKFWK